jgi:hypothetical protein
MKGGRQVFWSFWLVVMGLMILSGCQVFQGKRAAEETVSLSAPAAMGPMPVYYDFKDVPIPGELKLDTNRRSVYMDSRVVAGVLFFEGRIEALSLAAFFEERMPQDGWRLINTFRYQKDYQLSFQKEGAFCQITIYDHVFTTEVEVRRTPILPPSEPVVKQSVTGPVSPAPPVEKEEIPKAPPMRTQPIK